MKRLQIWLPLLFAIVMIVGMVIGFNLRENTMTSSFFKLPRRTPLQEVLDLVRLKYVDAINTDTLADDAIEEMLTHLDPHSIYIPASKLQEVNEDLQGNFQGIGVEFQIIDDTVHVTNVLPEGPSDVAGIQTGDQFLKVGDSLVAGNQITSDQIKSLLRGPGTSQVKLAMLRNQHEKVFTVKRGIIPLPSLDAAYMLDDQLGYIKLNKFAETTYEEFMQALEKLQKNNLQQLILDLRGNGGGILQEAVQIADEFLDNQKLIVYTQGNKIPKETYLAKREGLFEKGKLIVLVDELSASASEVLAGALQDWDRATIIGRRSFGKGLVQEQYQLSDGSALRLTVARYYTPLKRSIQKPYTKGVQEYNKELYDRFHNGEVLNGDTSKSGHGPAFKTEGGHIVYGGGGITPDIFVGLDSSILVSDISDAYPDARLSVFLYRFYLEHKQELSNYKTPADFNKQFKAEKLWEPLLLFSKKDEVDISEITAGYKPVFLQRLKANLARQIWRSEGFFEVWNSTDPVVKRAGAEMKRLMVSH
jgi:carboxyl-terminal processing protease